MDDGAGKVWFSAMRARFFFFLCCCFLGRSICSRTVFPWPPVTARAVQTAFIFFFITIAFLYTRVYRKKYVTGLNVVNYFGLPPSKKKKKNLDLSLRSALAQVMDSRGKFLSQISPSRSIVYVIILVFFKKNVLSVTRKLVRNCLLL